MLAARAPRAACPRLRRAARGGADIRETCSRQPSLESLFIKLTGKELRE